MAKKIKIELNAYSIDKAIKILQRYKVSFQKKVDLFRIRVAEEITELAKVGFNSAYVDDLVEGGRGVPDVSVHFENRDDSLTVVIADGEDAVWVEFGTGVHHNGSAGSSPHPRGMELGMTIGTYGYGLGQREIWGFYSSNMPKPGDKKSTKGIVLTRGTPAQMPMYNAMETVCNQIYKIAKEVFND